MRMKGAKGLGRGGGRWKAQMNKIIVAYKLVSSSISDFYKPNIQFRINPDMLHGRCKLKRLINNDGS
jgi:hypothetical protein